MCAASFENPPPHQYVLKVDQCGIHICFKIVVIAGSVKQVELPSDVHTVDSCEIHFVSPKNPRNDSNQQWFQPWFLRSIHSRVFSKCEPKRKWTPLVKINRGICEKKKRGQPSQVLEALAKLPRAEPPTRRGPVSLVFEPKPGNGALAPNRFLWPRKKARGPCTTVPVCANESVCVNTDIYHAVEGRKLFCGSVQKPWNDSVNTNKQRFQPWS